MNFDDDDLDNDEFSDEEFSKKREEIKKHPLRMQAEEILKVVQLLLECIEDETEREMHGSTLLESAYVINAKLEGALGSDSYLLCIQNAAIIRYHAEYVRLSNHHLSMNEDLDKKYIAVLRSEMEKFRALFILWAKEIHKMKESNEFEDEWGLF